MAGLTLEQLQAKGATPVGLSLDEIKAKMTSGEAPVPEAKPVQPASNPIMDTAKNYISGLGRTYAGAVGLNADTGTWGMPDFLKEAQSSTSQNPLVQVGEGALRSTASLLNLVFAPITQAVSTGAEAATNVPGIQKAANENPLLSKGADIGKAVEDWQMKHPEAAKDLNSALTIFVTAAGGPQLDKPVSLSGVVSKAKGVLDKVTETPAPTMNVDAILRNYKRAVKPSSAGIDSPAKAARFDRQVLTGVDSIVENKPNLSFTDTNGNTLKGETPSTIDELSQAITQTRKAIYEQYSAKAKAANEAGGTINVADVTKELDPIINDQSLAIAKPEAVAYAKELKQRLEYDVQPGANNTTQLTARQPIDPVLAEKLIEIWNASLKAFYKNPSYDTASKATIDALLANKMRSLLDSTIENTQGEGYQNLKNRYGALKSMEADVIRRQQAFAKQNAKGLIDFTDIFTGSQAISGILNLNPQQIATGLAGQAIKEYIKWRNSPDRAIEAMFKEAEKVRSTPQAVPKTETPKATKKTKK